MKNMTFGIQTSQLFENQERRKRYEEIFEGF